MLLRQINILRSYPASRESKRRGTAAVEFAMILPFLAVLVLGIMEMGRLMWGLYMLDDAARKACRNGTYTDVGYSYAPGSPNGPSNGIHDEAVNVMQTYIPTLPAADVTVTAKILTQSTPTSNYDGTLDTQGTQQAMSYGGPFQDPYYAKSGQGVSVTVSVPATDILFFGMLSANFLPANSSLSKTVVMTRQ